MCVQNMKTTLFTEQKHAYCEAKLQGRGGGIEGLYATADKTAETIEDILSGTMPPKQGLWVGYMHALNAKD